jgi:hypothetical protein
MKGPAAGATDAPQPWGFLCNPVMKIIIFCPFPSNRAPVECNWQGKTEVLGEKPVPVSLCPPQIPHGLTRGSNPDLRDGRPVANRLSHGLFNYHYFKVCSKLVQPVKIKRNRRMLKTNYMRLLTYMLQDACRWPLTLYDSWQCTVWVI